MSEGIMTYPWSDTRYAIQWTSEIGPWIWHNALRRIHGMTLFLKGKNDTCLTLGLYESVRPGRMCLGRCWRSRRGVECSPVDYSSTLICHHTYWPPSPHTPVCRTVFIVLRYACCRMRKIHVTVWRHIVWRSDITFHQANPSHKTYTCQHILI